MTGGMLSVTIAVACAALAFDFVNGFHDASNSIATIVATRVLKPWQAVLWAAFFNFAALFFFGTGVARTVGSGMVALDAVTPGVILAGLIAAIGWGLITWRFGIPTSSTHALLGGYAGAAMTHNALLHGWHAFYDPIIPAGWYMTLLFIVLAPTLALVMAEILAKVTFAAQKKFPEKSADRFFGHMQLFSSACLSLMHGSNDAQKTAGVIAGALVASGYTDTFAVPAWVLWLSYSVMGLGTLTGGWRIVRTLGSKLTRLRPAGGFCAESASALAILFATLLQLPVSTTHTTTGAIVGVGAARSLKSVRWGLARGIMLAWIVTIPVTAGLGGMAALVAYLCKA